MSADSYPGSEHPGYPYDSELPFLEALEREVARNARRAAQRHQASTRVRRGSAAPLRGASRVTRRALTLVALLCLLGASAYGAREALSGTRGRPDPAAVHQGPLALVASGRAGSDGWSLQLYRRAGDLCRALVVAETDSSRCAALPGPRALAATSVVSPLRRYVFGVAGSEVPQVEIRIGNFTQSVATHPASTARARDAGLPARVRWFLAVSVRPTHGPDPPALVRPLDAEHRPLGSAHASCVETTEPQSCHR